jgi:ADP-ribose pyrophosphatase
VLRETVHLFFATGLEAAPAAPESAEVFEVHWMPIVEAHRWVIDGTITDAKTAIGIVRALHRL